MGSSPSSYFIYYQWPHFYSFHSDIRLDQFEAVPVADMFRPRSHVNYSVVIFVFLLANLLNYFYLRIDDTTLASEQHQQQGEVVPTYTFPPQYATKLIPHLTPIDQSTIIPRGSHPIDVAHRRGYLHTGHCIFIMDTNGLLLFLKRSSDVVTCPSTWSILGEHSTSNETPHDTVIRGMEEELGLTQQRIDALRTNEVGSRQIDPIFSADFQTTDTNIIHVEIRNITQYPLYYIRHYGPRLDNRIDSQLTYLWLARLPKRHEEIEIRLDDEVADHKWISLDEFSDWIEDDAKGDIESVGTLYKDGYKDDGPPSGDFCHPTIRSLYAKGLDNLKLML